MLLKKLADLCYKALYWAVSIGFGVLVVMLFVQVVTRNIFHYTSSTVDELSKFLFAWIIYLGVAMAVHREKHISIEFVTDRLKGKHKTGVAIFNTMITLAFFVVLAVYGIKYAQSTMNMESPIMHAALGGMYFCVPLSAAISVLFCLSRIADIVGSGRKEGDVT